MPTGKLGVVLSAQHSSEDNFVLARLAVEHFQADKIYLTGKPAWRADDILRHGDANPNRAGAIAVSPVAPEPLAQLAVRL